MMEKILIIQTAFIGDAILTLPMIEKLKKKNPSNLIDILCVPSTQEIFSSSPFISEVLVMDKRKSHKSFAQLYKFSSEIKKRNYSKIYSPHRSLRSSFIVMRSGVRETFGFSNSSLPYVYKNLVEYKYDIHEVQRNLDLIGFNYTTDSWKIVPQLSVNETSGQKVKQFISSHKLNSHKIAIAPGSIWETKKYPEEYFRDVIAYFAERSHQILVIGGEADKELCMRISSGFGDQVISTAGSFSVIESIELLKHVQLLVTNDSAPTHLGLCADIPVLTIYCSTVPEFGFYPYNKKSSYIGLNDLDCKPCGIHGYEKCPLNTFDCGNKLNAKIIINKMENILGD